MPGEDSMALAVGQALLDLIAASAPELRGVGDMDGDGVSSGPDVDETTARVDPVYAPLVFDDFLRKELVFERDLAERRNLIDDPVHDGLVFVADEHMNVRCFVGAVVDQEESRGFAVEFDPPFVGRLIRGNAQRPLADRIRVCAYLVRLAGKAVGVLGQPLRVSGDPVGFLRESVRLLRELIRLARLEQGDKPGDGAKQAAARAETGPNHIPIHEPNTTQGDRHE